MAAELYQVIDLPVNGVPKGGRLLLEPYQAEFLIEAGQLVKVQPPAEPAPIAITVKPKAEKSRPKAPSLPKSPKPKPEGESAL